MGIMANTNLVLAFEGKHLTDLTIIDAIGLLHVRISFLCVCVIPVSPLSNQNENIL